MTARMSKKYVEDHQVKVHTAESWGRSVAYHVLDDAARSMGKEEVEEVTVNGTFHVSPVEPEGCIRICLKTPFGVICFHQPI